MSVLMDILEKQIVRIIDGFHGKAINDEAKVSMKKQVQVAIENYCFLVNKKAPMPIMLLSFERQKEREGILHLVVEFRHPKTYEEITILEWEDEFEDGVTQ